MKVLLIMGPTGIGKTNLSIEMAKKNNCPVIVLDRIQCFSELSILSGRPNEFEFKGTKRIYITKLYIKDGKDIKKELLMKYLIDILNDQSKKQHQITTNNNNTKSADLYDCIIEGGSITLLNELLSNNKYPNIEISSILYLKPDNSIENHKKYFLKIQKRVKEMCFPSSSNTDSMINEVERILASNQNNHSIRNTLQCLVGDVAVDKVMEYIDYMNSIKSTSELIDPVKLKSLNKILINNITHGHFNYALSQIKTFDGLIKHLNPNINITIKNIKI